MDCLILSSNLFSVIKNFDVLDYDPLFSDVHCALQFSFSVDICLLSAENRNISKPVNWDNCKKDEFVEYLTVNKNNEIKNIVNSNRWYAFVTRCEYQWCKWSSKKSLEYFQAYFC